MVHLLGRSLIFWKTFHLTCPSRVRRTPGCLGNLIDEMSLKLHPAMALAGLHKVARKFELPIEFQDIGRRHKMTWKGT